MSGDVSGSGDAEFCYSMIEVSGSGPSRNHRSGLEQDSVPEAPVPASSGLQRSLFRLRFFDLSFDDPVEPSIENFDIEPRAAAGSDDRDRLAHGEERSTVIPAD